MDFMGICIDFLAWPLIALGYPMVASIRAIESGSKHHLRKLVIYWTIFSLISLFEFAFVKIIYWIPLWSSIKLVAIFWLVMPGFEGACDAYESLIQPLLRVDLQAIIERIHCCNQKEKLSKSENFMDIAEEYIKENGVEALEKLISSKRDYKEPDNSQRGTQVLEPEEKDSAATAGHVHFGRVQNAGSNTFSWVPKEKNAACEVKETTPVKPPEIPPPKKPEQEWYCDLCKVKPTSEKLLNAHLQGSKHKAKCEAFKASKLSETGESSHGNSEAAKSKDGRQGSQQKSWEKKLPNNEQKQDGASTQEFKLSCSMCNVKLVSEIDLASHVKGRRHLANVDKMVNLGGMFS